MVFICGLPHFLDRKLYLIVMSEELRNHIWELLKSSDFSDVTIVSDDQKIFKGHRNILSGFSPVLNKLFKVDSQYHPAMLYLNGINSSEINAIMEFIYCNTIPRTWTEQLQSAVISLEINGLQEHIPVTQINVTSLKEIEKTPATVLFPDHETIPVESKDNGSIEARDLIQSNTETSESKGIEMSIAKGINVKVKLSDLVQLKAQYSLKESNEKIQAYCKPSLIESKPGLKKSRISKSRFRLYNIVTRTCNQCKPAIQFNSKQDLTQHITLCHKGDVFKCELHNFITTHNENLQKHINKKHLGIVEDTPCDQCDYNPRDRRNLMKHKKVAHQGLRYPCNFCEYKAVDRTCLKNHISSIHEGIKHQCHQCGKQFAIPQSLNCHIREFHEGIRMKVKCEFCEYHATKRENLRVHFQKMHKDIPIEIFREKMKSSSRKRGPRKPTEQSLKDKNLTELDNVAS